jgi:hypothetical protein
MTKSKLALDSETERELLIDLWNIEEMAERGNLDAVKEQLATLIEEVRFSEVIESYKVFDVTDNAREEDLLETISSTVKNTPNNMELGKEIRQLFSL